MTIETPKSPTSPMSPTSAHPMDGSFTPRPPPLQVITTFPLNSLLRRPSVPNGPKTSPLPSPGQTPSFRAHREHLRARSGVSNTSFPSPIEALLAQPLSSLPTPPSPHARISIDALLNPVALDERDGRQSRMAMRSPPRSPYSPMTLSTPTPLTAIRSPILEQVVSLPLRVNTAFPISPMETHSFSAATTAVPISRPESRAGSPGNSRTRWTPTHTRSPAILLPPHTLNSARERSPIRRPHTSPPRSKRRHSPPPKYHVTLQPTLASTLNSNPTHPPLSPGTLYEYRSAISHLRTPLVPLISVTSGLPHPEFPRSLLQYHLLTHEQLDSLAKWYHQTEPSTGESWMYPAWIPPYTIHYPHSSQDVVADSLAAGAGGGRFEDVCLATKRRRWGRFIGLRGCESPVKSEFGEGGQAEEEEGLVERMEREWRNAMRRARDEEALRDKGWRGRW